MSQKSKSSLPISFSDDNNNANHTRGIQIANRSISDNIYSAPSVQQKGNTSQISTIDTTNNKPLFGSSKYPQQIITLEIDDIPTQKQSQELISETQLTHIIGTSNDYNNYNNYCNDISSYSVNNQTCLQVLNGLKNTLYNYSFNVDMSLNINNNNNTIEGMVFMNGYMNCIQFKINIWKQNENITRFELLRIEGDAMVTAKFLGDIQSTFFKKDNREKQMNFISLGFDASELDLNELFDEDIKMENENESEIINIKQELNGINEALIRNDMYVIDVELQTLHDKINENNNICDDIIEHKQLINTILNQLVKNKDIRVVRGCLLILKQLCSNDKISLILCEQYKLIDILNVLLNNNKYSIIKNYVVQILAKHTKYMIKNYNNMKNAILKYENEWKCNVLNGNECINQNMFNKIYKRLSEIMQ